MQRREEGTWQGAPSVAASYLAALVQGEQLARRGTFSLMVEPSDVPPPPRSGTVEVDD